MWQHQYNKFLHPSKNENNRVLAIKVVTVVLHFLRIIPDRKDPTATVC